MIHTFKCYVTCYFVIMGGLFLGFSQTIPADIYVPLEFQKAYQQGTRTANGTVSPKYWQNHSVYNIKATLEPSTRLLTGEAIITYYNESPDSLKSITFHTYHDYYKPDSKKAGFFRAADANEKPHEGMVLDQVLVGDQPIDLKDRKQARYGGTNYSIILGDNPVPPGGKVNLKVDWHYVIPGEGFERSGAIDPTSMFVAYWYPEMAVYDDIDGWDRVVYDAATEFYHDYSDYHVELTIPDNFMVWASVAPDNPTEVYSEEVQKRLEKASKSTEAVSIIGESDFKTTATKNLTWKYTAKNFPDFSFALSDHFVWDAAHYSDKMGDYFIQVAYPTSHPEFAAVLETIGMSLEVFHNQFPVYEFPFHYFTIFNGLVGGGMEFAGMANDQETSAEKLKTYGYEVANDTEAQFGLSLHEMCHMYFPFMMGINEKKYAWMDEGFASFSSFFMDNPFKMPERDLPYLGSQEVLPIMAPSHLFEGSGLNSYTIGSHSYKSLYELLGEEIFTKCMKAYMDAWKHKHPTPYDFMMTFNRVSGENLNWFWKAWYFDWGYMDMGIDQVNGQQVTLKNLGGRPMAMTIKATLEDGSVFVEKINPKVWKDSNTFHWKLSSTKGSLKKVELEIPSYDAKASNNTWEKS